MTAHPLISTIVVLVCLTLFFAARLWPTWHARDRGCDAFYFLLCADGFRREKRIPIVLPELYLLEPREQWYPPGFTIFLALFPRKVLNRYYWLLSHLVDALVLLAAVIWTLYGHGVVPALLVAAGYAFASGLLIEYAALTSRALATVLFGAFLLGSYAWTTGSILGLCTAIVAGAGLLLTHKLTIQLLWFLIPFLAAINGEPWWLLPLAVSYVGSFVIAPGLMIKILRAHWDIVTFWYRNWRYLGAHQIRNSPVYGDGHPAGFHYGSLGKAAVGHARLLFQFNPWVVSIPVAVWFVDLLPDVERFLVQCVIGIYLWAALTLYVNTLKCLGEGTKYVKFSLPMAIVISATLPYILEPDDAWIAWTLFALAGLLQLAHYLRIVRWLRCMPHDMGGIAPDLISLLDRIAGTPGARLLCLPAHLADAVAFKTGKPVLWGTHGYGFREAEPFFPVLRKPIEYFVERYGLTHLLLDTQFTTLDELRLVPGHEHIELGHYCLTSLDGVRLFTFASDLADS